MRDKIIVQKNQKSTKRDKKAKIITIQDAMCMLIETKGYENVTIRDIAEAASVSIGLIYKYFPGGKFDILKEIGYRYTDELLRIKQPETIDFNDFPGYMRDVIKNMQQFYKDNSPLIKALIMATLSDSEIMDEIKKMDVKDYKTASEFFCRFNGVDIGNKDPLEVLVCWGFTVKSIILCDIICPLPLMDEEALTDLMVDLSLKIWGYQEGA
ncbi:TetR family transcriptional regulator [Methanosarcina sp. A14]|uniref:Transcriptional regulator, TetR family n=2 Tax=Methanosarcina barkeri TaxID=2208 RepID=A0A0E3QWG5_METBA|nr:MULTISPECIES: TetR/AcrR family transcriptional regulator [Methanosarcina]AKB55048.1 Transcriptional regulator, TetR family [Methanosarcina barkeri MS]AKJ37455.1 TetR family transcriptional regulator [Methanosarcina barkeri CM1]OEC91051.1 TetR family transcriptional regulator [Methanosarcina sp. A14]